MKSFNDKKILIGLVFLGLAAGLSGRFFETAHFAAGNNLNSAAAILATEQNLAPQAKPVPEITLGFVGDIMLDRGVSYKVNKYLGGDYAKLFAHTEFLKAPDIMMANLEGPVSNKGYDRQNKYSFRMDPKVLPILKNAGIDIVSSANNHINDWGNAALTDTLKRLRAAGILTCGIGLNKTDAETPAIFNENGQHVGFLCFTDVGPNEAAATKTRSGVLLASDPDFDSIVRNAAQKVNSLIVVFHFGVEYQTVHNARQEELAKRTVDDGAAMVVGAHPHVAEDMTTYKGAPIIYSLGNFIFDQAFSKETMQGAFVTATLKGKAVTDVTAHTVVLDKNYVPTLR